jgi:hypothetical protein
MTFKHVNMTFKLYNDEVGPAPTGSQGVTALACSSVIRFPQAGTVQGWRTTGQSNGGCRKLGGVSGASLPFGPEAAALPDVPL